MRSERERDIAAPMFLVAISVPQRDDAPTADDRVALAARKLRGGSSCQLISTWSDSDN
jgi:hypothetical protein